MSVRWNACLRLSAPPVTSSHTSASEYASDLYASCSSHTTAGGWPAITYDDPSPNHRQEIADKIADKIADESPNTRAISRADATGTRVWRG